MLGSAWPAWHSVAALSGEAAGWPTDGNNTELLGEIYTATLTTIYCMLGREARIYKLNLPFLSFNIFKKVK